MDAVLSRGLTLGGIAMNQGSPEASATVTASGGGEDEQTASADDEGRFVLEGLAPGHYTVFALAEDGAEVSLENVDPATSGPLRLLPR